MAELLEPKKPMTAYFLYLQATRAAIVKQLGDKASERGLVAKTGSQKWNALAPKDKAPYEKEAAALKVEYNKELEKFKAAGGVVGKRKADKKAKKDKRAAKKAKKESGMPKRPAGGAYGVFLNEVRPDIV